MAYRFKRKERVGKGIRRILRQQIRRGIETARDVEGPSQDERVHDVRTRIKRSRAAIELCDDERTAGRDAFVASVLGAVEARDLGPAVSLSESKDRDKSALRDDLRALAAALARGARHDVEAAPGAAAIAARRYAAVSRAVSSLERNASPG